MKLTDVTPTNKVDRLSDKIKAIKALRDTLRDAPLETNPETGEIEIVQPSLLFCKHLVEQIMILGASDYVLDFQKFSQYTGNIKTGLTRSQAAREAECPEKGTIRPYPLAEPVE